MDFVAMQDERRMKSQEGGPRSQAFTANTSNRIKIQNAKKSHEKFGKPELYNISETETGGAISYTIKEGGTLKKKVQPMAADKVERGSFAKSSSVTAPG